MRKRKIKKELVRKLFAIVIDYYISVTLLPIFKICIILCMYVNSYGNRKAVIIKLAIKI